MANRYSLDCPIDGTSLALNRAPSSIKLGESDEIGTHVHVIFDITLTCSNGHVWQLEGDIVAERVG